VAISGAGFSAAYCSPSKPHNPPVIPEQMRESNAYVDYLSHSLKGENKHSPIDGSITAPAVSLVQKPSSSKVNENA
jgi:hypothetical protein